MSNKIRPKRSYTATNTPTLITGEIGINAADGKIWIGNAAGNANVLVSSLARSDHTGTLGVANGGTGLTTLTANNVILGNGTSTPSFVAPSTSGNVLTSNGTTWQSTAPAASSGMPTGAIMPFAAISPPTGYLLCDGSAVSRSTYATLFSTISPSRGTITVTIASPAVVTLSAHGFQTGDIVYLTTTGALPTGLAQNTLYYVISVNSTTFRLATSAANAAAGTAINTSGTQSGTHTLFHCPYGLGNGSTTFNVPNLSGRTPIGSGTGAGLTARVLGTNYGAETVALSTAEMPQHNHTATDSGHAHTTTVGTQSAAHNHNANNVMLGYVGGGGGANLVTGNTWSAFNLNAIMQGEVQTHTHGVTVNNGTANVSIGNNGSGTAHNNIQPSITMNYIIKT